MKKKDLFVIGAALILAAAAFLLTRAGLFTKPASDTVRIYVNGDLFCEEKLGEEREIVIEQENGARNVILLTEDGFCMKESTCKNRVCIDSGRVTKENCASRAMGNRVICLPNRVEAELVLSDGDEAVPDA